MNRWVLLKHSVYLGNSVDIHYDFLLENDMDCLTWKFFEVPSLKSGFVAIKKQPNHRLIWLTRVEHELSMDRGFVKRIDYGNYSNVSSNLELQDLQIILEGKILNGLFQISGNFCRLTNYI